MPIERMAGGLIHAIDLTYKIAELAGFDTLQIVQVFYATPLSSDTGLFRFEVGGIEYVGCVDGGCKSPNVLAGHQGERVKGKPYYYAWADLKQQLTYVPSRGIGKIRFFDGPNGLREREASYFETAIVGLNGDGAEDVLLHVLKWGWDEAGRRYSSSPGAEPDNYEPDESDHASETFDLILKDNYSAYRYRYE